MVEDSTEEGRWETGRPVECRALIAYDAAAAAQARSSGVGGSRSSCETTGVGSNSSSLPTPTATSSSSSSQITTSWGQEGTRIANHGFVGLSNQGATCYMNSLLQTLYMTPEFRAALYRWKYDKEEDDDCIPLQLQRLFGLLQLSTRGAVETKPLTKSFGWTSSDGFQQHDVQELCKVLFDAFEREVQHTPQSTLVNDLYQGTMTNYVRCKECGKESQNPDAFLELSLVMRPFGSKAVMSSVLESLDYCLKPETLEGDNQYFCDNCQKKVDAVKGCKFSKLPYLLCLQLKRFDYDFTTFTRIKLNDEMRFPLIIDMNPYMTTTPSSPTDLEEEEEAKEAAEGGGGGGGGSCSLPDGVDPLLMSSTVGEPEGKSCEEPSSTTTTTGASSSPPPPVPDLVDCEGIKCPEQVREDEMAGMGQEERSFHEEWDGIQLVKDKGPYVYELYGVLIHSGSALGGHYYAYIRSLEDGQWYNFNDSTVTRIDVATVKRAWGGPWASEYGNSSSSSSAGATKRPYYYSSSKGGMGYSGANAYMLMYRRIDPSRNAKFPLDMEVPGHVREGVVKDEERAAKERLEYDKRLNSLTLRIITTKSPDGTTVTVSKKDTLGEVTEKVWRALNLHEQDVALDCIRLREYGEQHAYVSVGVKDEPLGGDDETMERLGITSYKKLFVEMRKAGEEWQQRNTSDLTLHVRRYIADTATLETPSMVFVGRNYTVGDFRKQVARSYDVSDVSRIRLAVEKTGAHVDYWTKRLEALGSHEEHMEGYEEEKEAMRLVEDCGIHQLHKVYLSIAASEEEEREERAQRKEEDGEEEETYDVDDVDLMEEALNRETNLWTIKVGILRTPRDEEEEQEDQGGAGSSSSSSSSSSMKAVMPPPPPPLDQLVEIYVDRRAKIATLRIKVARLFNLMEGDFKLLVKKNYNLAEIKGRDTRIKECNPALFNNSQVYVWPGHMPLRDGEHVFRIIELKTRYRAGVRRSPHVVRCDKCAAAQGDESGAAAAAAATMVVSGAGGVEEEAAEGLSMLQEEGKKLAEEEEGHKEEKVSSCSHHGSSSEHGSGGEGGGGGILSEGGEEEAPPPLPPGGGGDEGDEEEEEEGSTTSTCPPSEEEEEEGSSSLPVPMSDFGLVPVECMPGSEDYEERLSIVVDDTMTMADVRIKVATELKKMGLLPEAASTDRVRLRDKLQFRAGKIFRDTDQVRLIMSSRLDDTKDVALQVLDEPERLHEEQEGGGMETIVVVQWFCRTHWCLGLRYEFPLSHTDRTLIDTFARLAGQLGIEADNLRLLNIVYANTLKLSDLGKEAPLAGKPWIDPRKGANLYISDGELLLCQDISEPLRTLTEAELASIKYEANAETTRNATKYYSGSTPSSSSSSSLSSNGITTTTTTTFSSSTSYSWKRPAEKGVRIRTKEERMKEAEKQQQELQEAASAAAAATASTTTCAEEEGDDKVARGGEGYGPVRLLGDDSAGGDGGVGRKKKQQRQEDEYVAHGVVIMSLFDEINGEAGDDDDDERSSSVVIATTRTTTRSEDEDARESAELMGL